MLVFDEHTQFDVAELTGLSIVGGRDEDAVVIGDDAFRMLQGAVHGVFQDAAWIKKDFWTLGPGPLGGPEFLGEGGNGGSAVERILGHVYVQDQR